MKVIYNVKLFRSGKTPKYFVRCHKGVVNGHRKGVGVDYTARLSFIATYFQHNFSFFLSL